MFEILINEYFGRDSMLIALLIIAFIGCIVCSIVRLAVLIMIELNMNNKYI